MIIQRGLMYDNKQNIVIPNLPKDLGMSWNPPKPGEGIEGFDGTPKKGAKVELQAGLKLKAVDSATSGSTSIGEITDVEGEYFVIRVKA